MADGLKIAVMGAGIAGLSCATRLKQSGCVPTVFEKSRGLGGRMNTRRSEGWQCDLGAQYFTARDPGFRAEVARWEAHGAAGRWQATPAILGGSGVRGGGAEPERFVGVPRMSAPARLLADGLEVRCATTVQQFRREAEGWQLETKEHGWLPEHYHALVLALPAPQAATLLAAAAPDQAALAAAHRMRPCWALALRYDKPLDLGFDAAFVNEGPLRWIARDSSKPGRPPAESWLLHASPVWSEQYLEASPDTVTADLLAAFATLDGQTPADLTVHRWRYADSEVFDSRGHSWDAVMQLGLCGDWLNHGKVEGAWLSGHGLAAAMITSPLP